VVYGKANLEAKLIQVFCSVFMMSLNQDCIASWKEDKGGGQTFLSAVLKNC